MARMRRDGLRSNDRGGAPALVAAVGLDEVLRAMAAHDRARDWSAATCAEIAGRFLALALGAALLLGCNRRRPRPAPPPKAAAAAPRPGQQQGFSEADYADHVAAVRARIGPEFTVRIERPFVVVGDLSPEAMLRQSEGTVRWASAMLKQDFFSKDPASLLEVWLFKDAESYESHSRALFGIRPPTPYGFYSSEHRALILLLSPGAGVARPVLQGLS